MTKRTFLAFIIAILALAMPAGAQSYSNRGIPANRWRDYQRSSYFGLRFGLNVPTLRYKGTGGNAQTNPLPRYHLGLVYGQKLGNQLPFYIETGMIYTEKGAEIEATRELGQRKVNMKYLQIPLVLKYKLETAVDDLTIQPFFGGFMAFGLAGETKDYGIAGVSERMKYSTFDDDSYKRFDSGLRLGCGMAFQNFYVEMGYDIGLFNIAGDEYHDYFYDDFDGHIRTGNFTMTVGVDF